jgi:hypothetical protein
MKSQKITVQNFEFLIECQLPKYSFQHIGSRDNAILNLYAVMMPLRCKAATELEKMTIWWLLSRGWKNRGGKILRQMHKSYSFFNNQTSFRLDKLIHKNDWIKMLRFAEQK